MDDILKKEKLGPIIMVFSILLIGICGQERKKKLLGW